ncbi:putative tubulin-specific chaperone e protein [Botrytis fragariae]|uniref:Putative tubulin-specific chaperone e protein n=1 Tax=Botrytis fragariae TaxID=1964551 RepID=A0A8H6ALN7_9HELO|nr:putative tubulin-specific chaperone e protein [Botrytis fragariae]KAF5870023.1 putative tubulin-specific chaperone e protein [Botrytis fragariae]
MSQNHNYRVGQRVSFQGQLCTIRYIGEVKDTEKEWLGVEWDDPSRGKNDGKGYFKCLSNAPTPASFIRPTRKPDPEQSFVEAVFHKYASGDGLNPDKQIVISGKVAEEIGFDKIAEQQAQVHELKIVLVDGQRINRAHTRLHDASATQVVAGTATDLTVGEACPSIVELDLSRNLFVSLDEIENICSQLKNLKTLRLNGNRLELDTSRMLNSIVSVSSEKVFNKIKALEVDSTLLDWNELCILLQRFTSTVSLTASSNGFKRLSSPITSHSLASLTLEYNDFTSLADLEVLTQLTSLESLLLKGNKIHTTRTMTGPGAVKSFAPLVFNNKLSYIDLSSNKINSWDFVDELVHIFPGMTSLRISKNLIYPETSAESTMGSLNEEFMLTLARLGNLQKLNFSGITPQDRNNAELFYLSEIGKELGAVDSEQESTVLSKHKRYKELLVRREKAEINPAFLEARLIKFTFYVPANPEIDQKEIRLVKEIPKAFSIYRVKGIVGRLLNRRPLSLKFIWETGEWDPVAGYEDIDEYDDDNAVDDAREALAPVGLSDLNQKQSKREDSSIAIDKAVLQTHGQVEETKAGRFMKREVELEDTTKDVGLCVDGMEARVRVEFKDSRKFPGREE